MSRYVVGLTGGIAAGKSEVTRRFEALGIVVADADLAARAVVAAGSPALGRIAERFGADMLLADDVVVNDGRPEDLQVQVEQLHARYIAAAAE
ncbi:dephospho-CoA kinase [Streptomyces sp. NPDC056468]|uniref:dephospho-CoA kinase n=1 Tax=Streptomyces sp. NPDC056468 TaxID=3345830 RepID=UPI0036B1D08B